MTNSVSDTALAALIADLTTTAGPAPAAPAPDRCPVTELITTQCAHCRPTLPAAVPSALGPWFCAAYHGSCAGCGTQFDEDERIRSDGDGGWLAQCCGSTNPDPDHAGAALAALIAPTPPQPQTPRPCDNPFCSGTSAACGWTPVEHISQPYNGQAILATAPGKASTQTQRAVTSATAEVLGSVTGCPTEGTNAGKSGPPTEGKTPAGHRWPGGAPTSRPDGPPPSTVVEMRQVLTDLDASRPRSQQIALGPSELGTPCQRQIAMKLAGVPRQLPDARPPWAPMQGTAMHTLMAEALEFHNRQLGRQRWIVEERLSIHPETPGADPGIHGHGDAFDTDTGTVVDWKYTGITALRDVTRKTVPNEQLVKPDYRVQAHLYGYGHERAGRDVRWVRLVFLARSHDYDQSAEWTERYQPEIALAAINRYYATQDLIKALDLANNPALWPAVPAAPGKACSWCPFRRPGGPADMTGCPGDLDNQAAKQLRGLIP